MGEIKDMTDFHKGKIFLVRPDSSKMASLYDLFSAGSSYYVYTRYRPCGELRLGNSVRFHRRADVSWIPEGFHASCVTRRDHNATSQPQNSLIAAASFSRIMHPAVLLRNGWTTMRNSRHWLGLQTVHISLWLCIRGCVVLSSGESLKNKPHLPGFRVANVSVPDSTGQLQAKGNPSMVVPSLSFVLVIMANPMTGSWAVIIYFLTMCEVALVFWLRCFVSALWEDGERSQMWQRKTAPCGHLNIADHKL